MVNRMILYPLERSAMIVLAGCAAWFLTDVLIQLFAADKAAAKIWKGINIAAAAGTMSLILYAAVFGRSAGDRAWSLVPFESIRCIPVDWSTRQEKLVNFFVFVPFGLSFPRSLPENVEKRAALGLAAGCLLSILIELTQLVFALGMCETDDVIVNTAGTLAGVLIFAASCALTRLIKDRTQKI